MYQFPQSEYGLVAGVDEVGRGPLVGAVVAAAVIFDINKPIIGLADSKKLSEKKRLLVYTEIVEKALAWGLGRAEAEEIDQVNILQASLLAMQRAINSLSMTPNLILVDGNRVPILPMPSRAIVKGDSLVDSISAASILAKVTRDGEMIALDKQWPQYGFAQHKGYPTALHLQKIKQHGITPLHRRSFAPVHNILLANKKL